MFFFKKKQTLKSIGFFQGFTDYHCHILPGVDDGVQSMEEALKILKRYEELGVKRVWLTPHIMEDVPNKPERLHARFDKLTAAYEGKTQLHLAAENMLDTLFDERFDADMLLPLGTAGNQLLVETSYFSGPTNLMALIRNIMGKGYFPVLAHPERYMYMSEKDYKTYKDMGVRFQLNLPSLAGVYGKHVKSKAEWMLQNHFYDCFGTDLHKEITLDILLDMKITAELETLLLEKR